MGEGADVALSRCVKRLYPQQKAAKRIEIVVYAIDIACIAFLSRVSDGLLNPLITSVFSEPVQHSSA